MRRAVLGPVPLLLLVVSLVLSGAQVGADEPGVREAHLAWAQSQVDGEIPWDRPATRYTPSGPVVTTFHHGLLEQAEELQRWAQERQEEAEEEADDLQDLIDRRLEDASTPLSFESDQGDMVMLGDVWISEAGETDCPDPVKLARQPAGWTPISDPKFELYRGWVGFSTSTVSHHGSGTLKGWTAGDSIDYRDRTLFYSGVSDFDCVVGSLDDGRLLAFHLASVDGEVHAVNAVDPTDPTGPVDGP